MTPRYTERNESDLIVADLLSGEVKKKIHSAYPNNSAALPAPTGRMFYANDCNARICRHVAREELRCRSPTTAFLDTVRAMLHSV
jgi:hypothetical protein